jgi:hypothetical protein
LKEEGTNAPSREPATTGRGHLHSEGPGASGGRVRPSPGRQSLSPEQRPGRLERRRRRYRRPLPDEHDRGRDDRSCRVRSDGLLCRGLPVVTETPLLETRLAAPPIADADADVGGYAARGPGGGGGLTGGRAPATTARPTATTTASRAPARSHRAANCGAHRVGGKRGNATAGAHRPVRSPQVEHRCQAPYLPKELENNLLLYEKMSNWRIRSELGQSPVVARASESIPFSIGDQTLGARRAPSRPKHAIPAPAPLHPATSRSQRRRAWNRVRRVP